MCTSTPHMSCILHSLAVPTSDSNGGAQLTDLLILRAPRLILLSADSLVAILHDNQGESLDVIPNYC